MANGVRPRQNLNLSWCCAAGFVSDISWGDFVLALGCPVDSLVVTWVVRRAVVCGLVVSLGLWQRCAARG